MKQGLVRLLYNFGKRFMGWTLHMIMCVLLCYPVSFHISQLLSTGRPISSFKYVFIFTNQDFICSLNKCDLFHILIKKKIVPLFSPFPKLCAPFSAHRKSHSRKLVYEQIIPVKNTQTFVTWCTLLGSACVNVLYTI